MARSSQSSIKRLDTAHDDFDTRLAALTRWASVRDHAVELSVREIIDAVRTSGDEAVIELTNRFDKRSVTTMAELMIDDFSSMRKMIDSALDRALELPPIGSDPSTSINCSDRGTMKKPMARFWDSSLRR